LNAAEIVAEDLLVTFVVLTVKVAEVFPTAIVTVVGGVAADRLLARVIKSPPVGAALPIVTVPVLDFPPATLDGLKVSVINVGGLIVSVAL